MTGEGLRSISSRRRPSCTPAILHAGFRAAEPADVRALLARWEP
ncbi:MAG TPA: hypothetical protein VGF32_14900 [Streptosporangiaceae bacterium]